MAENPDVIVVGVDGSPSSVKALQEARRLGTALHATLRVVTTWQVPVDVGSPVVLPEGGIDWEGDSRRLQDEALQEAFGDDVPSVEHVVVPGNPAGVLIDESAHASMVVVGSRGHSALASLLLGSVSTACAERAECPVVVVH